jgi:hypothetical protein
MIPFEAMNARLQMDNGGIKIFGAIPNNMDGNYLPSILADSRGGIIYEPLYEPFDSKINWPSITRWLTHDPFEASITFQQPLSLGTDGGIQQASHHVPSNDSNRVARWLTTVLPMDSSAVQRR